MNKLCLLFASLAVTLLPACSSPPSNGPDTIKDPTKPATTTTIEVTAQWQAAPENAFGEIAATSAGDQGALAYALVEGSAGQGFTQTRIMLQRIDNVGVANGAAIELGVIPNDDASRVTLASDGIQYMACWSGHDEKVACATAPVTDGPASPTLALAGHSPSIAYGSNEWALAYANAGKIAVLHVANDGAPVGDPVLFDGSTEMGSHIRMSAMKAGFAVLGASGDTMHVFPLDSAFSLITPPIDLGKPFWFGTSMAASETNVAVDLGKPYGGYLFVLDGAKITSTNEFGEGGDKTGMNATLAPDTTSFGMLSADFFTGVHYGLIDEGGGALPTEGVLNVDNMSYFNGSLAILKLKETNFVVASQGAYSYGGKIVIARVQRF